MTHPLLDIRNATVYRNDAKVFDQLNLTIAQGENVAILGPNGAGKSTLLKLLTREIYPVVKDDSWVRILGSETVNVQQLRQKISWVSYDFQTNYLPITTGYEVVMSGLLGTIGNLYQYQISAEQEQQVLALMAELNLLDLQDKRFFHLSSGQQRRLLLARAEIVNPQTIILDEPTSSLDIQGCFQMLEHMQTIISRGASVILATHHIHEIIPAIDRVIFIRAGRIIADGSKQALLTSEHLSDLYQTSLKVICDGRHYQVLPD